MEKKRLSGLDFVRSAAIIFVIVLHSISLSGILDGEKNVVWGTALYIRQLCMSSVPLFLILSGYLQKNKKLTLSYYCGIIPLYLSYFVISALCMAVYAINGYVNGNMDMTLVTAIYKILDFSANGYAWYFEMYIGLFLLIPFLNLIYSSIGTKLGKIILIATLAFLTLVPDTLSGFSPYYGGGSSVTLAILPDFFKAVYPITYYFIGSFIAEYRPRLSVAKRAGALILAPMIPTLLIALYTHLRGGYAWYMLNGFQTLTVAFTAICVFTALYDIDTKCDFVNKCFACISKNTFEIYLLSYIWDNVFYSKLGLAAKLPLPVVMLAVFASAFVSAVLLNMALRPVNKLILRMCGKMVEKTEIL